MLPPLTAARNSFRSASVAFAMNVSTAQETSVFHLNRASAGYDAVFLISPRAS